MPAQSRSTRGQAGPCTSSAVSSGSASLRHHEAEVERRRHERHRSSTRPTSRAHRGARDLDAHIGVGQRATVQRVAEGARAHAEVGDMAQPRGRCASDTESLHHVLTVCPRLHETRGGERNRRHRSCDPRDAVGWFASAEADQHRVALRPPPREHLGAGTAAPIAEHRVLGLREVGEHAGEPARELVGVGQCGRRELLAERQVRRSSRARPIQRQASGSTSPRRRARRRPRRGRPPRTRDRRASPRSRPRSETYTPVNDDSLDRDSPLDR